MDEPSDDPGGQISRAQRAIAEYTAQRTASELASLLTTGGDEPGRGEPLEIATLAPLPLTVTVVPRVIIIPNPAAGAEWTITVPAGFMWRLLAVRTRLATSATVINRAQALAFSDGVTTWGGVAAMSTLGNSNAQTIIWMHGITANNTAVGNPYWNGMLPDFPMPAGTIISSSTANLQAGDTLTGISLFIVQHQPRLPDELADFHPATYVDPYPGLTSWATSA